MSDDIDILKSYAKGGSVIVGNFPISTGDQSICLVSELSANFINFIDETGKYPSSPLSPLIPLSGCTDPNALNYNPLATIDDGSCTYPIVGCTDPKAMNYNPLATIDGYCTYLSGCTDPKASNYNPLAVIDDGSCVYTPIVGKNGAYIGFGSATGACYEYGVIHKLFFQNDFETLDYSNGFNLADFKYNGDAVLDTIGNGAPGSTPNSVIMTNDQGVSTFFRQIPVKLRENDTDITHNFSVYLEFTITPPATNPCIADGITFIIQAISNNIGGGGGGIGYAGVCSSVAVKFDTYWNGGPEINEDIDMGPYGYPGQSESSNYVGMVENGDIFSHGASYISCTSLPGSNGLPFVYADGRKTYVWIEYTNDKWYVYLSKSPNKPASPLLNGYYLPLNDTNAYYDTNPNCVPSDFCQFMEFSDPENNIFPHTPPNYYTTRKTVETITNTSASSGINSIDIGSCYGAHCVVNGTYDYYFEKTETLEVVDGVCVTKYSFSGHAHLQSVGGCNGDWASVLAGVYSPPGEVDCLTNAYYTVETTDPTNPNGYHWQLLPYEEDSSNTGNCGTYGTENPKFCCTYGPAVGVDNLPVVSSTTTISNNNTVKTTITNYELIGSSVENVGCPGFIIGDQIGIGDQYNIVGTKQITITLS